MGTPPLRVFRPVHVLALLHSFHLQVRFSPFQLELCASETCDVNRLPWSVAIEIPIPVYTA